MTEPVSAKPWHLLNPSIPRASDEVQATRLSICKTCDKFVHMTKQCGDCSCVMPLKVKLPHASCPIGKW